MTNFLGKGEYYIMEEKNKGKSALTWFCSTVPICVAPIALSYLFCSYTSGKLLDIKEYTDSIILMICSIACGLMVLAFDSSKKFGKIRTSSKIYSCSVALVSGGFYFYIVGCEKEVKDNCIFVIGAVLIIICVLDGIILGKIHDKNTRELEANRIKLCRDFFEEAIPFECKSAFAGIEKVGFCEMKEVDPIERLKAEKEKAEEIEAEKRKSRKKK